MDELTLSSTVCVDINFYQEFSTEVIPIQAEIDPFIPSMKKECYE